MASSYMFTCTSPLVSTLFAILIDSPGLNFSKYLLYAVFPSAGYENQLGIIMFASLLKYQEQNDDITSTQANLWK